MLYPELISSIEKAQALPIHTDRLLVLNLLIDYCKDRLDTSKDIKLNFICTHNSRRSQFSQVWGQLAAVYYAIPAKCFSGGVEVTAFNERAVASIERSGFQVTSDSTRNPKYEVSFDASRTPILAFSKLYNDATHPSSGFAAIMTCSHADENCPFIPGADARIPLRYEDPKAFDNTNQEEAKYDERSLQIASELLYVFSQLQ